MTDQQNWVKTERAFDAPIEAVWDMWTNPEMFKTMVWTNRHIRTYGRNGCCCWWDA